LFRPESIVERKSTLFSIVVAGVVAILPLPIIIPHLLPGMVKHPKEKVIQLPKSIFITTLQVKQVHMF
jgi:hypothetical protein